MAQANQNLLETMQVKPGSITFEVTLGEDEAKATKTFTLGKDGNFSGGAPSALLPGGSSKKSTRRKRSNRKRKQGTKSKRARRNRSSRNK